MENKKKVLCLFDYACSTGFATVSKNIVKRLYNTGKYDFDIIAINGTGEPLDSTEWPGKVWPAVIGLNERYRDLYGRQQFVDKLVNGDYDLIFIIQDTFIVETFIDSIKEAMSNKIKQPSIIFYYPIDAPPKGSWVQAVNKCDIPVAYTYYAKDQCVALEPKLERSKMIHHGVDLNDFNYMEPGEGLDLFKKRWFEGYADDKFLMINVNRNQSRKDVVRTFMILNVLKRRGRDNIHLYMHMAQHDVGGDLNEMAQNFGLEFGKDWTCPANFTPHQGVTIDALNHIYNVADCMITCTLGEGFGLSIIECALTKTPMVLPNNSCIPEIMANNRAFLTPAGDTPSMWIMKEMDNERIRPLMNVEAAADQIERIMDGDLPDLEGAHTWALQHSWDNICKEWELLFDAAQPNIVPNAGNQRSNGAPSQELMNQLNRADRRRQERENRKQEKKKSGTRRN